MANLPSLDDLSYMAGIAEDVGIAGKEPIQWSEIYSYIQCSGVELTPWESDTLRKMSQAYLMQSIKSQDPKCLSPVFTASKTTDQTRSHVDASIRKALLGRSKK